MKTVSYMSKKMYHTSDVERVPKALPTMLIVTFVERITSHHTHICMQRGKPLVYWHAHICNDKFKVSQQVPTAITSVCASLAHIM